MRKLLFVVLMLSLVLSVVAQDETPTPEVEPEATPESTPRKEVEKSGLPLKVIKAGKLIDVVSARILTDQFILIEGNTIKDIGPNLTLEEGAEIIDLSDKTVLPGLIDCHVHIIGQAGDFQRYRNPYINQAVFAHIYAQRTLKAGFTSIRSLGSNSFDSVSLMRAIDRGIIEGPRMRVAAFYIGSTGSHGDIIGMSPWAGTKRPPEMSGIADGVDGVRKKVRYLVKYGATVIKFGAGAGVLSGEDNVAGPQYSQEEMNAIVDEAKRWGKRVTAHAHGAKEIKMALKAGVDSIEHGSLIDDEGIALMKQKGAYLISDIFNHDYIMTEYKKFGVSPKILEKEKIVGDAQRKNFQKAHEAGVKIAFGTDAGIFPHGWNARQLKVMVRFGLTPMQALEAATINAADVLDWKDKIGSIEKGKFADIIAVDGDPIDDISVLESVSFVMKDGKVVKR